MAQIIVDIEDSVLTTLQHAFDIKDVGGLMSKFLTKAVAHSAVHPGDVQGMMTVVTSAIEEQHNKEKDNNYEQ